MGRARSRGRALSLPRSSLRGSAPSSSSSRSRTFCSRISRRSESPRRAARQRRRLRGTSRSLPSSHSTTASSPASACAPRIARPVTSAAGAIRSTSGSRASSSSSSVRCGDRCRASRGGSTGRSSGCCALVQAAGVWLTLRSAVVARHPRPRRVRALAGRRRDRIQDVRAVRMGAPPDLHRLVSDGLRRVADDDDAAGVCRRQLRLPAHRDPVRGAIDARAQRRYERYMKQVPWRFVPRVY